MNLQMLIIDGLVREFEVKLRLLDDALIANEKNTFDQGKSSYGKH